MVEITKEAIDFYKKVYPEVDNKEHLLDTITPFYKGKLDALAARSAKVMYLLAEAGQINQTLSAGDLARKMKVESKNLSVTLSQLLEKKYIHRKAANKKNYVYFIEDSVFLEWAAMRFKFRKPVL